MKTLYLCGAGNNEGVRLALTVQRHLNGWDRLVLLDDDSAKHGQDILGVPVVGSFSLLGEVDARTEEVVNLVTRGTRKRWAARRKIGEFGLRMASLVSPDVDLLGASLDREVTVYQNAIIGPRARVGEGSVVWMGGVVGQECQLGRFCVVGPQAVINGRVSLGDGVYVGANATILPEVKIGAWATIGAGSVAIRDVPAGATIMGVPGKIVWTQKPESFPRLFAREVAA